MEIELHGTQAPFDGPSDWFTGTVRIVPLFNARALQESLDDRAVDWMEHVTDDQYQR